MGGGSARTRAAVLVGLSMALMLAWWASAESNRKPPDARKIFASKCVPCHKADGSGGIRISGNPTPDWRDAKRMADPKYDDAYLRDCITNGKSKSGMVAWGKTKQLQPAEIESLIVHIRGFSKSR